MSEMGGEFETEVHGCMMHSGEFKDALNDCKLEFGEFASMHDCKSNMIEFEAKGHGCMLASSEFGVSLHETPLRRGAGALRGWRACALRLFLTVSHPCLIVVRIHPSTLFHHVTSILHDNF